MSTDKFYVCYFSFHFYLKIFLLQEIKLLNTKALQKENLRENNLFVTLFYMLKKKYQF